MSVPHLLPEILDYIADLLHAKPETLKRCCLVSKSWIPRTRKHLFADIRFRTKERLKLWKKTFPDPSTSPARYAKTLFIECSQVVVAADAEPGGWITGFSRVVHFGVHSQASFADGSFSLVPFHGLSPVLKSLRVTGLVPPSSQIIDLILSFPLLEDLVVYVNTPHGVLTDNDDSPNMLLTAVQPSNSPVFSGFLELHMKGGMGSFTRQLLSLPIDIHFRKLALTWFHEADYLTATALVERCSHALESLKITGLSRMSVQHTCPDR
jgi:hypothetical protein